ncbi:MULTISPECIES: hypothetical protein [Bacteria]|uniref:Uncharacterized protein n=2 Tax=Aerococcus TaxID=1375 RepID=A0ABT4C0Z5_9LACT|nr:MULTISPECIES: hypothetical protein [Bacteria]MDK6577133.1 hypothetical protein [Escherichia coli]MCY3026188.1 hypothetical protein [Aerococcus loyolae]MCY3035200.1 hypothetical protein [Aerococcus mictus]MCY3064215.1 hypothetical protein [Aerococcus mictus]MCY3067527.1 hypothetical protein [Aerococcus mictus]
MTQFLVAALIVSVAINSYFLGIFTAYDSKLRGEERRRNEEIY